MKNNVISNMKFRFEDQLNTSKINTSKSEINKNSSLHDVAQEFESLFVFQMLKNARQAKLADNILSNKGDELVKPLQHHLSNVMWEHCGVVKDKKLLVSGLEKVKEIKELIKNVDVRLQYQNCDDLVQIFDLEASTMSAEATIIAALNREESRGSHQRSDYPLLNTSDEYNSYINLNKQTFDLDIQKKNIVSLIDERQNIISKSKKIRDFKGKLLE